MTAERMEQADAITGGAKATSQLGNEAQEEMRRLSSCEARTWQLPSRPLPKECLLIPGLWDTDDKVVMPPDSNKLETIDPTSTEPGIEAEKSKSTEDGEKTSENGRTDGSSEDFDPKNDIETKQVEESPDVELECIEIVREPQAKEDYKELHGPSGGHEGHPTEENLQQKMFEAIMDMSKGSVGNELGRMAPDAGPKK